MNVHAENSWEGADLGGERACPLGVRSSSALFLSMAPGVCPLPGSWALDLSPDPHSVNKLQWMSRCAHLFPFGRNNRTRAPFPTLLLSHPAL